MATNFTQVTIVDFALMESLALKNKARVVGHEIDKLLEGKQGVLTTIGGVLDTVSDDMEIFYDFPLPRDFHIECGH